MASLEVASLSFSITKIESDPHAETLAGIMHRLGKLVLEEQPKGSGFKNNVWPPRSDDDIEDDDRCDAEVHVTDSWPEGFPRGRQVNVDLDDRSIEIRYTLRGDEPSLGIAVKGEAANQSPAQIIAGLVLRAQGLFVEIQQSNANLGGIE